MSRHVAEWIDSKHVTDRKNANKKSQIDFAITDRLITMHFSNGKQKDIMQLHDNKRYF